MPRTTITSMFGTSPVSPLQKHMEAVQACVKELTPFIESVLNEDWDTAAKQQQKIAKLENEADSLKRELRMNLPRSLFMPVSRRDLLEVLTMQTERLARSPGWRSSPCRASMRAQKPSTCCMKDLVLIHKKKPIRKSRRSFWM